MTEEQIQTTQPDEPDFSAEVYDIEENVETIASFLIRDKNIFEKFKHLFKKIHFNGLSDVINEIWEITKDHVKNTNTQITKTILQIEIEKLWDRKKVKMHSLEEYNTVINNLFNMDISETDSVYVEKLITDVITEITMRIGVHEILNKRNQLLPMAEVVAGFKKVADELDRVRFERVSVEDNCKGLFEFLEEPDEEPDYLAKPILLIRDKGYLVAPYKVGKTLSAIQLTLCLSKGMDFLNFEIPKPRKVFYLRFELSDFKFKKNLRMMMRGLSPMIPVEKEPVFKLKRGFNILDQKDFDWLIKQIEKYEAELLIIDPLYKFSNLDLSKPEASIPLIRAYEKIRIRFDELCILTLHHPIKQTGKGKKSTSWDTSYGAMQIFADMDFEMRLRELEPQKTFRWDYISNSEPVNPMTLRRDPDTLVYYVSGEDKPSRSLGNEDLKEKMKQILQRYHQEHGEYMNQTKFKESAIKELKLTQRKFRELEEQGKDVFWKTCPGEKNAILYEPI